MKALAIIAALALALCGGVYIFGEPAQAERAAHVAGLAFWALVACVFMGGAFDD